MTHANQLGATQRGPARPTPDRRPPDAVAASAPTTRGELLVLLALVVLSAAVSAVLGRGIPSPWIVPDELIYSELAKGLVDGLPSIRGETSFGYGLAYPLLLAPFWAAFDEVATAYAAAKAANALVMSLAAVPAYFLARRFASSGYSLVVAALSIAVPSMLYTGVLMTEVALYPAFVLALLAIVVAIERPTTTTQLLAFGAIALACAVKLVSLVLLASFVAAILLHELLASRAGRRRRLSLFAPVWIALGAVVVATIGFAVGGGRPLGAYQVVLDNVDLVWTPWWALLHAAELVLLVAVIPAAASAMVVGRGLRATAPDGHRVFASVAVPLFAFTFVVVGAFASTSSPGGIGYPENVARLHERSTFVLAPLLFVGLMLWLRSRPARQSVVVAVAAAAALLPAAIPLDELDENVRFQALALVPWVENAADVAWPAGVLLFTGVLGGMFVLSNRGIDARLVVAPVAAALVLVGVVAYDSMRAASEWTRDAAWTGEPDWVDRAVPDGATVSVLWAEPDGRRFVDLDRRHRVLFVGEFFNRSLGDVYEVGSPLPYGLPSVSATTDSAGTVTASGRPVALGDFVLVPCHIRPSGRLLARDEGTGAAVYRVGEVVRVTIADPASCRVGAS